MQCLWWWALDYANDGDLSAYSDEDIADAMLWDGDATALVEALQVQSGFVDHERIIHNWYDYAGKLVDKRRTDAERKRNLRRTSVGHPTDIHGTSQVPYPTVPNRTDTTNPTTARDNDELWGNGSNGQEASDDVLSPEAIDLLKRTFGEEGAQEQLKEIRARNGR